MSSEHIRQRKFENVLQTTLILSGMVLLLGVLGRFLLGHLGMAFALAVCGAVFLLGPELSPAWIMRLQRGRPLSSPRLVGMLRELARRAELPRVPQLYHVPTAVPNAFAVGNAENAAIGITDGLLRRLDASELAGVLAHEVSHIRNRDLRIMSLAGTLGQMTRTLSFFGQIMLLLTLPLALFGGGTQGPFPWSMILLLVTAPALSGLLQLALSRTREFDADLDAARLTADPAGLASALLKLEPTRSWLWRLLMPYARREGSPLLRSHPATAERVRRLRALISPAQPRFEAPESRARYAGSYTPAGSYGSRPGASRRIVFRPRMPVSILSF